MGSKKKNKKLTAAASSGNARNPKSGVFLAKNRKTFIQEGLSSTKWNLEVLLIALPKFANKVLKTKNSKRKNVQKQKNKKVSYFRLSKKSFALALSLIFTLFFFLGIWSWQNIFKNLPSPDNLTKQNFHVSTKIYDRNGELLYTIYKDQNRTPIPFDEIPIQVRSATIAAEDASFYLHSGFSIKGMLRALYKNIKNGEVTGGSTITQQLVKNTLLTPEKTISRKIKEIILSIEVERKYSKDQILEMYINAVPYGGTAYGIEEAAQTFFGKDANELTLGESALLASLPQSPTKFSPFGGNPEVTIEKKNEVLRRMFENGFITKQQELEAQNEEVVFSQNRTSINAPHFVFYVRDLLEEKYGKDLVQEGGLNVTTSLDLQIQKLAEEVVAGEVDKLTNLNVTNAAVVVLDPKTGEVLAMVGSRDYFDTVHDGQVNVALRPRQPGSSIKVVNYSYALEHDFTPATIIEDRPTIFKIEGQDDYVPKNYDGEFRGNITLRSALAESRNIPAVKILASYGVEKMLDLGSKMGITTWTDPKNYGLSLTLGGGEVRLLDLAQVYATIADYGKKPNINPILSVTDFTGKTFQEFKCISTDNPIRVLPAFASSEASLNYLDQDVGCGGPKVISPETAYLITDILKDNNARSPAFGINSLLNISGHPEVAVKTGTSNDLRDNLAVGYTRDYLVAVWIGNNDNSPMSRVASGVTGATPIFNKITTALLADKESTQWPVPDGLIQLPICPYTGTLACQGCPLKMEWFKKDNKPEKACSSDWFKKDNGGITPTPGSQYNVFFENQIKQNFQKIKKKIILPPPRN